MDSELSIGLFNTQPEQRNALLGAVEQTGCLSLALETDRWEELEAALFDGTLDIVLVNLDDDVEFGNQVVQRIVRTMPGMSVIGVSTHTNPNTIISAMRAGCSQFVCSPIDRDDFRSAVDRIGATRMAPPHKSCRICLVGASGGAGATTLACNLAIELAQVTGRTSALVDLNLEYGDAAFSFDCEPPYSLADLCSTGSPIDRAVVESAVHQLPCNVALLGRPAKVADARLVTPEGVEQCLRVLGTMYPCVVVDLPRGFSLLSSVALEAADHVLVVTQLSIPSIRNASRVYDVLLELGAREEKIQVVLNRCRAEHQRVSPDDVEKHFRRPIFAIVPNDYRRVKSALELGQPIMTDSPNSPARLAIHEMAKNIAKSVHAPVDQASAPVGKGLFKRWWGSGKSQATPPRT